MKPINYTEKTVIVEEQFIVGVDIKSQFAKRGRRAQVCRVVSDLYMAMSDGETEVVITNYNVLKKLENSDLKSFFSDWITDIINQNIDNPSTTMIYMYSGDIVKKRNKPYDAKDLVYWVEKMLEFKQLVA